MSGVTESGVVGSDVVRDRSVRGRSLGRGFAWLWAAYAVSTFGTRLAFDAFPLIAVVVLDAGPAQVAALAAAGLAVGAVVAVPLGPWVEFRRKRPVMIATDLVRCAVLMSVPLAYALGRLGFAQLLVVSVVVAAADITFRAAAGSCLKALVRPSDLLRANGRFESTTWTAAMLGPPVGGAAIGLFGPVVTVAADAVSYLLSALGIRAIGGGEPRPRRTQVSRLRTGDLLEGWRYLLSSPVLRPLFLNTVLVNGLIMATAPLLAVLMLGDLGFAPWQYSLAFAVPCVGGLVGARLAGPLVARFGEHRVLVVSGVLRACWPVGLVFVGPGTGGAGPGDGRRVRADHVRGRVQPGVRHPSAGVDAPGPGGAHPVGLDGQREADDRGADRGVGPAGRPGRDAYRGGARGRAAPGDALAAAPSGPCSGSGSRSGFGSGEAHRRRMKAASAPHRPCRSHPSHRGNASPPPRSGKCRRASANRAG
ncbi:hypothetical protein SUDANB174_06911 [Streptomyces sp. enrichment culture]